MVKKFFSQSFSQRMEFSLFNIGSLHLTNKSQLTNNKMSKNEQLTYNEHSVIL